MALVQTCKCEECGLQRSFANHWVMIIEHKGSLTVLPVWDEKKVRRARHFCGRAHASRFVERWIANPEAAMLPDVLTEAESNRNTSFSRSEDERAEDREDRKIERMLMQHDDGEEMSSARIVPTPAAHVVSASLLQAVPTPPACVLPPSLTRVLPVPYAREIRMMS
jgi:hypothetical protein